jgi:hypothetical protein
LPYPEWGDVILNAVENDRPPMMNRSTLPDGY